MACDKYRALMRPLRIRGKTLKSRFMFPVAQSHFLQGPEPYPADPVISYYCDIARQGCGLIITHELTNPNQRNMTFGDGPHFAVYDIEDPTCQNYFTQFVNYIHFYGSLVGVNLNYDGRSGYCINDPQEYTAEPGVPAGNRQKKVYFSKEKIREYIDWVCERAKLYRSFGFDAIHVEMSNEFFIGQFLNPKLNHRTDEYGGSFENRTRYAVELMETLRNAVGDDMIISCNGPAIGDWFNLPGTTPMPGYTGEEMNYTLDVDEAVRFMDMLSPWLDIYRIQGSPHRTEPATQAGPQIARQLKAAGAKCLIAVNNPAMDLELINNLVQDGTADLIAAGRMFLCNDRLDEILENGNEYDLNHCLGCSVCRGVSQEQEWMSHCTINPRMGAAHRIDQFIRKPGTPKRVAIIGGGPGGMKCALWLKERGHKPVIFEKQDHLGGLIHYVRFLSEKALYTEFLDALIRQIHVHGIDVRLNTIATPDVIRREGFDVVIAAVGARPKKSEIDGASEFADRWNTVNLYGHAQEIGHRVTVIGGSSGPVEAAMYLDAHGHDVTVLSRKLQLFHDVAWHHVMQSNMALDMTGVKTVRGVQATSITQTGVWYRDAEGTDQFLPCDDVIAAAGLESNWELAEQFYESAKEFYAVGDCRQAGDLRTAIADAYAVAMRI